MLQTLTLAKNTATKVTIYLATNEIQDLVTISDVNSQQITAINNNNESTIPLADIDAIAVYRNTILATTVESWAIIPAENPIDPVLGLAVNSQFPLTVNFKSGIKIICTVLGEADPAQSDLGFIANDLRNPNTLLIFINRYIKSYAYDTASQGFGTVGSGSAPSLPGVSDSLPIAAAEYFVRKDGDDNNTGLEDNPTGAFATVDKALSNLKELLGNNQNITIWLGDSTALSPHEIGITQTGYDGYGEITIKSVNGKANCFIRGTFNVIILINFSNLTIDDITLVNTTNGITISNTTGIFQNSTINDATIFFIDNKSSFNFANTIFDGDYNPATILFRCENRSNISIGNSNTFNISFLITGTLLQAKEYSRIDFDASVIGLDCKTIDVQTNSIIDASALTQDANNLPDEIDDTSVAIYTGNNPVVGFPDFTEGSFDDDTDAGNGGLLPGQFYTTTGNGAAPLNAPGIVIQKQ